ncbi:MAG: dual OB domain-containing protein [Thermomicrobiales bacterium]
MKTRVTITDLTRMQGDRVCVAGYLPDNTCVRPVFVKGGLTEEWLRLRGKAAIRPFAVIEFDVRGKVSMPLPPHTEDRIIDDTYRVWRGSLTPEERAEWCAKAEDRDVAAIFGAAIHDEDGRFVLAGEGARSLGTVRVKRLEEVQFSPGTNGRWQYRLGFNDQGGQHYRLPVTDLAFRVYLDYLRDRRDVPPLSVAHRLTTILQKNPVFLRIGLARGWERFPDRCYLQITGVYSFPDYLSGRCFADFAPVSVRDDGLLAKLSRVFRAS